MHCAQESIVQDEAVIPALSPSRQGFFGILPGCDSPELSAAVSSPLTENMRIFSSRITQNSFLLSLQEH